MLHGHDVSRPGRPSPPLHSRPDRLWLMRGDATARGRVAAKRCRRSGLPIGDFSWRRQPIFFWRTILGDSTPPYEKTRLASIVDEFHEELGREPNCSQCPGGQGCGPPGRWESGRDDPSLDIPPTQVALEPGSRVRSCRFTKLPRFLMLAANYGKVESSFKRNRTVCRALPSVFDSRVVFGDVR